MRVLEVTLCTLMSVIASTPLRSDHEEEEEDEEGCDIKSCFR